MGEVPAYCAESVHQGDRLLCRLMVYDWMSLFVHVQKDSGAAHAVHAVASRLRWISFGIVIASASIFAAIYVILTQYHLHLQAVANSSLRTATTQEVVLQVRGSSPCLCSCTRAVGLMLSMYSRARSS